MTLQEEVADALVDSSVYADQAAFEVKVAEIAATHGVQETNDEFIRQFEEME